MPALAACAVAVDQIFWDLGDIALSDSAAVILSRQSATMLQFQHERACFGKAG